MKTLHELATKLQEYIIRSQQDAHNQTNMNVTKYNNLKLKMDTKIHYPHVIVCIGISEAIYNIADGTKTNGSLGPDEKYVRKWLGGSNIIDELKEINLAMFDLIKAEDEDKSISMIGESDDAKTDAPRKKKMRDLLKANMMAEMMPEIEDENTNTSIERISVGELHSTPAKQEEAQSSGVFETVDNMKKGLKDYLKSMFRKS